MGSTDLFYRAAAVRFSHPGRAMEAALCNFLGINCKNLWRNARNFPDDSYFVLIFLWVFPFFSRGVMGGLEMTAERFGKGSAKDQENHASAHKDTAFVDKRQPGGLTEPLNFASRRLHKKLKVRRAINAIGRQQHRTIQGDRAS